MNAKQKSILFGALFGAAIGATPYTVRAVPTSATESRGSGSPFSGDSASP